MCCFLFSPFFLLTQGPVKHLIVDKETKGKMMMERGGVGGSSIIIILTHIAIFLFYFLHRTTHSIFVLLTYRVLVLGLGFCLRLSDLISAFLFHFRLRLRLNSSRPPRVSPSSRNIVNRRSREGIQPGVSEGQDPLATHEPQRWNSRHQGDILNCLLNFPRWECV